MSSTKPNTEREIIIQVPKSVSWTEQKIFKTRSTDASEKDLPQIRLQCSSLSGYSSNMGGIILAEQYTPEVVNSLEASFNEKTGDHFLTIGDKPYSFDLVERVGNSAHWLSDNGKTVSYCSNGIGRKYVIIEEIPSDIFYELLSVYPNFEKGSKSALLYSLFPLCQEMRSQSWNSQQSHLHHAEQRHSLERGANAMRRAVENITIFLGGKLAK